MTMRPPEQDHARDTVFSMLLSMNTKLADVVGDVREIKQRVAALEGMDSRRFEWWKGVGLAVLACAGTFGAGLVAHLMGWH